MEVEPPLSTLTGKEIDDLMERIFVNLEKELSAEIRK